MAMAFWAFKSLVQKGSKVPKHTRILVHLCKYIKDVYIYMHTVFVHLEIVELSRIENRNFGFGQRHSVWIAGPLGLLGARVLKILRSVEALSLALQQPKM